MHGRYADMFIRSRWMDGLIGCWVLGLALFGAGAGDHYSVDGTPPLLTLFATHHFASNFCV